MNINELINGIKDIDPSVITKAEEQWDSLAKPLKSLGEMENIINRISAIKGSTDFSLGNRVLLVFCGDNGVVAQGVSQSEYTVTTLVADALAHGTSTVSFLAEKAGCSVTPIDVGMKDETPKGVINRKVRTCTGDITLEPAMSRDECIAAILAGAESVREAKENGADIILTGEMGVGNTTTTTAVTCALLGKNPEELIGCGSGLSREGLNNKLRALKAALTRAEFDKNDPIDILCQLGGLDIAAMCGAYLGGAYYRIPVILDGVISCVAAVCAYRLNPLVRNALIASHLSAEPSAKPLLEELQLSPVITAGLHLGEGGGAVLLLPMIDCALNLYLSHHTFDVLGMEAYTDYTVEENADV